MIKSENIARFGHKMAPKYLIFTYLLQCPFLRSSLEEGKTAFRHIRTIRPLIFTFACNTTKYIIFFLHDSLSVPFPLNTL